MDVWYASYGSNLMEDRFLAYIYGGTPPGSSRPERGARDKTPPKREERVDIPYPLYFAKEKSKWGIGGVAFIGPDITNEESTIGRMYLITEEQFYDVVSQENNGMKMDLDLEKLERNGSIDIHDGWYNRVVFLGRKDGAPIFTFTSSLQIHTVSFRKPSAPYLSVIAKGLKELGLVNEEIEDYLLGKKGIDGFFTKKTLNNTIKF